MMNNIALIGFMGTGKSTIARKLATRLGWRLVDVDQWIEATEGMSIAEIFETKGEAHFRQIESHAIKVIMARKQQVVATGGGAVLAQSNQQQLLENALVVGLKADIRTIVSRVKRDRNRPLLQGNVYRNVEKLMKQRAHAYDFAHIILDSSQYSIEQLIEQIIQYKMQIDLKGEEQHEGDR